MEPGNVDSTRRAELSRRGGDVHDAALALVRDLGLLDRMEEVEDAQEVEQSASADLRTLDGQLAILGGLLRECLLDQTLARSSGQVAEVSELLNQIHALRVHVHEHIAGERVRRLDDLDRGLRRLRGVVDQNELLEMACEAAARACGFERVMLSRIEAETWRPWRSYSTSIGTTELSFREWIRGMPGIELSHMLLESELVRRREPAMVVRADGDSRVYEPMARAAGLASYVAAPILSGDRVIGLLHADHRGVEVVDLDRDVLWYFATGFAQIFERCVLLQRLQEQRVQVLEAMRTVEVVLDALATSTVDLVTREEAASVGVNRTVLPEEVSRSRALEDLLTARELEVLSLMATGATNDRIGQSLVIATATVKSHVKQILRKLRVENRAEAISRYLRMTIGASDG